MIVGKKISTWILVMAILITIASGCTGKKENVSESPTNLKANTTKFDDGSGVPAFEKNIKISIGNFDGGPYKDDPIIKEIEKRLNITIDQVPLSWNDYVEKGKVMMASKTAPDLLFTLGMTDPPQLIRWAKDGAIRALPDNLDKWPNVKNVLAQYDDQKIDGKQYVISKSSATNPDAFYQDNGQWYRKDLFDKYGVPEPKTLQEFYEGGKKVVEGERAKGNQIYLLTARDTFLLHFSSYVAPYGLNPTGYIKETEGPYAGKWVNANYSTTFWKAYGFLQKLYKEKLLDPDFATNTEDIQLDKFVTGKALVTFHNTTYSWTTNLKKRYESANPGRTFEKDNKVLPVFISEDGQGKRYNWERTQFWAGTVIPANLSDEKLERILYMFDWLLSEPGIKLIKWGKEGTDYKMEGDQYVNLIPKGEDGQPVSAMNKYRGWNVFSMISWGDDLYVDPQNKDIYQFWKASFDEIKSNNYLPLNLKYVNMPTINKYDNNKPISEGLVEFIMNPDMTYEQAFSKMIDRLRKEVELDKQVEELQKFAKSQGK